MKTFKVVDTDYRAHYYEASDMLGAVNQHVDPTYARLPIVSAAIGVDPDKGPISRTEGDITGLLFDAKRLLAGTFTPEPWLVEGDEDGFGEDAEPDVFDGRRIWYDDGNPGTMYVCQGFAQGADEGLGDARFVARAPELVRRLVAEVERLRAVPQEPDWLQRKYGMDA